MQKSKWQTPPAKLKLLNDEIHIWRVSTNDQTDKSVEYLRSILSNEEQEKADRFHFERDRKQYTIARGFLRIIIGRYLDINPTEFDFSYNKYGKPKLEGADIGDSLHFNLSHSGNMVLYVFSLNRRVGIDVELIKSYKKTREIVERFFSEKEKEEFASLPEGQKDVAFYTCWARKEAYIKAVGKGMSLPLDEFTVSMIPRKPILLLHNHNEIDNGVKWTLLDIDRIENYASAVAAEGEGLKLRYWDVFL